MDISSERYRQEWLKHRGPGPWSDGFQPPSLDFQLRTILDAMVKEDFLEWSDRHGVTLPAVREAVWRRKFEENKPRAVEEHKRRDRVAWARCRLTTFLLKAKELKEKADARANGGLRGIRRALLREIKRRKKAAAMAVLQSEARARALSGLRPRVVCLGEGGRWGPLDNQLGTLDSLVRQAKDPIAPLLGEPLAFTRIWWGRVVVIALLILTALLF
jgi:hypothetical protein